MARSGSRGSSSLIVARAYLIVVNLAMKVVRASGDAALPAASASASALRWRRRSHFVLEVAQRQPSGQRREACRGPTHRVGGRAQARVGVVIRVQRFGVRSGEGLLALGRMWLNVGSGRRRGASALAPEAASSARRWATAGESGERGLLAPVFIRARRTGENVPAGERLLSR